MWFIYFTLPFGQSSYFLLNLVNALRNYYGDQWRDQMQSKDRRRRQKETIKNTQADSSTTEMQCRVLYMRKTYSTSGRYGSLAGSDMRVLIQLGGNISLMCRDKPSPEQPIYQANLSISLAMHENEKEEKRAAQNMTRNQNLESILVEAISSQFTCWDALLTVF